MIKKKYLLTPGPTPVPEKVLAIASEPIIHHRTPEFSKIYKEVSEDLQYVFQTKNDVYTLTSSGTGAMETAVVNLVSRGDKVLVINGGKFGERWGQLANAYGAEVIEEKVEWGDDLSADRLKEILNNNKDIKVVFSTLSETSTGTVYDIKSFGEVVKNTEALLVVDGISGLAATECPMDEWGIDVLITGSQKSLMIPPGTAYISLNEKAWEVVEKNSTPNYYFNLKKYKKSHAKDTTPYTPALTLIIQQREALKLIKEITLEGLLEHHKVLGEATRSAIKALGLELFSKKPGNILTSVKVPDGIDGNQLVKSMQYKYMAHISNAQDPMKGKFFRIAHLGYMGAFDVMTAISALEMTLMDLGYKFEHGAGIRTAQKILQENWK